VLVELVDQICDGLVHLACVHRNGSMHESTIGHNHQVIQAHEHSENESHQRVKSD
jgi:hypothetical protein